MSNHPGPLDRTPAYWSYLLRLWYTHSAGTPVWRASLEIPLTQEVWRFDDLPSLFAFLCAQVGAGGLGTAGDEDRPPATAP